MVSGEFDEFWAAYPLHTAKKDAEKAFAAAIKKASLETILRGVEQYRRDKPAWCNWKHPGPWLRGERWADEPATQLTIPKPTSTPSSIAATVLARMQEADTQGQQQLGFLL